MFPYLTRLAEIGVYLVFIASLGAACLGLSRTVASQAVAVVLPYVVAERPAGGERRLTLVERRRIEAPAVVAREPAITAKMAETFVPEAPATPLPVLAAQMDRAEQASEPRVPSARRGRAARVAHAGRRTRVAAADVFGRSFGVMLTVSR